MRLVIANLQKVKIGGYIRKKFQLKLSTNCEMVLSKTGHSSYAPWSDNFKECWGKLKI